MAGHNKWSQIKHKKAKEDSKRGKAFTKLIKEITVAAREGGGDPAANSRLRMLVEKAKEINMPAENSTRAIKRGTGELPGVHYTPLTYEGYGPFGIAVIVDTLSDNKNRTVADLRRLFSANGGNLGEGGSVSWMFEHLGVIRCSILRQAPVLAKASTYVKTMVDRSPDRQDSRALRQAQDARALRQAQDAREEKKITEDELLELLLEFDVKDIRNDSTFFSIFCDQKSLDLVKQAVKQASLKIESAEFEWVPKNTSKLTDTQAEKALAFLSALHDHDDVQNVYANLA